MNSRSVSAHLTSPSPFFLFALTWRNGREPYTFSFVACGNNSSNNVAHSERDRGEALASASSAGCVRLFNRSEGIFVDWIDNVDCGSVLLRDSRGAPFHG